MTRAPRRQKPISGLTITESELRKLIRNELARQHLVNEGFFDSVKNPFKKLGEKAKKLISKKAEEILSKLEGATESLKKNEEAEQFLKNLSKEKGGMSPKELISSVPELSELQKQVVSIKKDNLSDLMKNSSVKEGSLDELRLSLILAEEKYEQKNSLNIISESVVAAVAGAWWGATKTVVGVCGLMTFACEAGSKVAKYVGFEKVAKKLSEWGHFAHHVEELFLKKIAFPVPVQYAAYRALWAIKHKGKGGEALSFEQFKSKEGDEERDATIKALKTAIIFVLVIEALTHIFHAVVEFFKSSVHTVKAGLEAIKDAPHAGVEASNLSKAATAAGEAAGSMAAAGKSAAGAKSLSRS